ncbi:alpha/beta-hydrolase [Auricularia subglabra TFB-10046 SS5]|nr:alpha/beta-hydrolase [Auricularia subglabra TFB-10046 SS5]
MLELPVSDAQGGRVSALLHLPRDGAINASRTAAILLSGAGGGVMGPGAMYLSMADKLAALHSGIPAMRLDYRYPARTALCVADLQAAMSYLSSNFAIERFVLVGWSFGGAPVFTVGRADARVCGCATVASQTADTDGIVQVAQRGVPVLLLHGTGDKTLSPSCSQRLYDLYGAERGERSILLFPNDDHALTKFTEKAEEMLLQFIAKCAGVRIGPKEHKDVVERDLLEGVDKIEAMIQEGDLRGGEQVE